jgi:UDP-2,3-diacylglucosamine pyrophosphatase LpxH
MTIVVVSDIHLGYEKSNVRDFQNFLDYLLTRQDVDTLVILGDFVDMWRRDVSGLFLEFRNELATIFTLQKKMTIYYFVGNHDYHLLELKGSTYPFEFMESKCFPATEKINYKFKHGHQYDRAQNPVFMQFLCDNLSNQVGQERTMIYDFFSKIKDEISHLAGFTSKEDHLNHLMQIPEIRLAQSMPDVEKHAFNDLGPNEILIFGHTHRAFVSVDEKVVNTGCWVSDATLSNTFVELDKEQVKLFQFFNKDKITEITERVPYPKLD